MQKIKAGEPIMVSSICKIAILLGVDISDIVEPNYAWEMDNAKTASEPKPNAVSAPIHSELNSIPIVETPKPFVPSCDLCQLRRNETCGKLTNAICEDYKEVPVTDPDAIGISFPGGIMDATYFRNKSSARKAERKANSD